MTYKKGPNWSHTNSTQKQKGVYGEKDRIDRGKDCGDWEDGIFSVQRSGKNGRGSGRDQNGTNVDGYRLFEGRGQIRRTF